jgi:hypothetical protein
VKFVGGSPFGCRPLEDRHSTHYAHPIGSPQFWAKSGVHCWGVNLASKYQRVVYTHPWRTCASVGCIPLADSLPQASRPLAMYRHPPLGSELGIFRFSGCGCRMSCLHLAEHFIDHQTPDSELAHRSSDFKILRDMSAPCKLCAWPKIQAHNLS